VSLGKGTQQKEHEDMQDWGINGVENEGIEQKINKSLRICDRSREKPAFHVNIHSRLTVSILQTPVNYFLRST
jgi:hypothetical protein